MERLIDLVPFAMEYEDDTADLGVTALMEYSNGYTIADYALSGEFEGVKWVVTAARGYERIAAQWLDLTGHAAPKREEV